MKPPEFAPCYQQGHLSVEKFDILVDLTDCEVGLQVAWDGRIWLCVNGMAFVRFKPKPSDD